MIESPKDFAIGAVLTLLVWKLFEWTVQDYYRGTILPAAKGLLRGEVKGFRIAEANSRIVEYRCFLAEVRQPHLIVVDALHDCAVGIAVALVAVALGALGLWFYPDTREDLRSMAWFSAVFSLAITTAVLASSIISRVHTTARRLRDPDGYRRRVEEAVEWLLKRAGESDEHVAARLAELDVPLTLGSPLP